MEAFKATWKLFLDINIRVVITAALMLPIVWYTFYLMHGLVRTWPKELSEVVPMYRLFEADMNSDLEYDRVIDTPWMYGAKYASGFVASVCAVAILPFAICGSTFGWRYTRGRILGVFIAICVFLVAYWVALFQLYFERKVFIRAPLAIVPNVVLFIAHNIFIGFEIARLQKAKVYRWAFPTPQIVLVVLAFVYFTVLPPIWVSVSPVMRAVLRLVVHPIVFEIAMIVGRICIRKYPSIRNERVLFPVISIQLLNSLYGRFLLVTMGSLTATIITTILLSAQELLFRFTVPHRDYLIYRMLRKAVPDIREILRTERSVQVRSRLILAEIFLENASIFISVAFIAFGTITLERSEDLDAIGLVVSTLVQLASEISVDYICVHVELLYFRLPIISVWRERYDKYFVTLIAFHVIVVYYFWSTSLSSLLCGFNKGSPDDGDVVLFYCTNDDISAAPEYL